MKITDSNRKQLAPLRIYAVITLAATAIAIVRLNQPRAHSILAERRKIGIKHNSTSFLVCFIIHRSLRESNVFAKIQVHRRILL